MKDSEFLAEIKAREELKARGYRKRECLFCKGFGSITSIQDRDIRDECTNCLGEGYTWEAPITK